MSDRLSPFQGPLPFGEADKDWFFGRDEEADEILSLILGHKAVLIYAQSGAGKTSLLNAKIIPELKEREFYVLPVARVSHRKMQAQTKPESTKDSGQSKTGNHLASVESLYTNLFMQNAIQSLSSDDDPSASKRITLSQFLDTKLRTVKDKTRRGKQKPIVIIFDQLEELFTLYPDRWREMQQNFFGQIGDALVRDDFRLRVILVIREDFLAHLDPFAGILPEKLRPRFRLERLNKGEAKEAIEEPLRKAKDFYQDSDINQRIIGLLGVASITMDATSHLPHESINMVDKIVDNLCTIRIEIPNEGTTDVMGEFVEPIYLQIVAQRLWEKLESSHIYEINTDLEDVDQALTEFFVRHVGDSARDTGVYNGDIRIWCEKKLITSSGTRNSVHKGHNWTGGMPNKVVDSLEKKHLIRGELRPSGKWYELTHDRLITPVIKSNAEWKNSLQIELEKKRKKFLINFSIPILASVIFLALFFSVIIQMIFPYSIANIAVGRNPESAAVNPATKMIYVANNGDNTVSVINGTTNNVTGFITVGRGPYSLAVNPATNMIYVADDLDNAVSVINGTTNKLLGFINVGRNPESVAINPATNMIYVANNGNKTVSIIDGLTNYVIGNIAVGRNPAGLAVNPATKMIYVANNGDNTVSVINGTTNNVTGIIPVGRYPYSLAVNPATNMIYVANYGDNTVSVINGLTNYVIGNIAVGRNPAGLSVNPATNMIYVANFGDDTVSAINGITKKVVGIVQVGHSPIFLFVNPDSNRLYVANNIDNTISTLDNKIFLSKPLYPGIFSPNSNLSTFIRSK
jgi:YVTN family beta-propeller protein